MKLSTKWITALSSMLAAGAFYLANAQSSPDLISVSAPQEAIPPNVASTTNKPMMMLASSKDHTLFAPIYTDYEDIDGDGILDTTFKPIFKYYGYFDSSKCYAYQNNRFEPVVKSNINSIGAYSCPATASLWSGNFLNWATMSRVDVIRKMLYGGKRSTDGYADGSNQISTTVLERVNLSKDSHSFVKHYAGQDIRDYTPFTTSSLTKTTGSNINVYAGLTLCNRSSEMSAFGTPLIRLAKGNYSMWSTINGDVCRWKEEMHHGGFNNNVPYYYYTAGTFGPKLARYFFDKDKGDGGIAHESELPTRTVDAATYSAANDDLIARVQVCVPGLIEEERCQAFPEDSEKNLKPYGIFQEFGLGSSAAQAARAEFGVITGSYDQNLQAGVLRKNMGDFSDEINTKTGVFCHMQNSACEATLADGRKTGAGAIKAFDAMALFQRGINEYDNSGIRLPQNMQNGILNAWGNPLGEMLVQTLNYYAGSPSSNPAVLNEDNHYGIPVAAWKDPLSLEDKNRINKYGNPLCRPMYTLALSSSALSFDADAGDEFQKLPNRKNNTLDNYVNLIGKQEGINDTYRSVGSASGAHTFGNTCSKKMVANLSDVSVICPEAPAIGGSYQIAGASWYGNTSMVRNIASLGTLPSDFYTIKDALKVKTMGASLAGGVPRVEIPIPNQPGKYVYITPESVFNADTLMMPGGILSFQSISSGPLLDPISNNKIGSFGSFIVSFNDKLFGGDYDMDISGFLRYEVTPDTGTSSGYLLKIKTDIVNVGGGFPATFGFSIIGSDQDGRYLTHQHAMAYPDDQYVAYGYKQFKNMNVEGYLCGDVEAEVSGSSNKGNRCYVSINSDNVYNEDHPLQLTFKMIGVDNVILQDPLWYAAKYGYFDASKKNIDGTYTNIEYPENNASWDNLLSDGSRGNDGIPDGYFLARRPEILEAQLRKALNVLSNTSNAVPALSTNVLAENSLKYSVKFDSSTVTGELQAHRLLSNGEFDASPTWDAGNLLHSQAVKDHGDSRAIITNDGATGMAFRWNTLPSSYQTQMTTAATNKLTTANAQIALAYIRGNQTLESSNGLRERGATLLGPTVNSSPWLQQRPMANWGNVNGYADFYSTHRNRANLLWLGANDGMLHAFKADTGDEVMAYVPGALANRLGEIPLQRTGKTKLNGTDFVTGMQVQPNGTVWPYVDGNPYTADVKVGGDWHTYVFGSLGRGGRGVFALDATHVNKLSESNAAQIFKWQFTSADDVDLGYQTADVDIHPSSGQASPIVRLNNGKFAMLIGNGQRSLSGKAALFILYLDGPDGQGTWSGRYQKIVVDSGKENGLAPVRWEDLDGDGSADVAYAGDLKGNVWKFDLSSADPSKWDSAYSTNAKPAPLFTATTGSGDKVVAQAITTAPEVLYMAQGGIMVNFATGNAFSSGSFGLGTPQQSVYGIWDRGAALSKPQLMRRSYTRSSDGTVVVSSSGTSATVDWSSYQGWVIDLPANGEAVLSDPSFDAGVLSFVSTRPKSQTDQCNNLPANTLYTIDPIAGLPQRNTQGEASLDGAIVLVAGKSITDPKVRVMDNRREVPRKACKRGDTGCTCQGTECSKEMPVCAPGQRSLSAVGKGTDATMCYSSTPRLQWREIPGVRTYPD